MNIPELNTLRHEQNKEEKKGQTELLHFKQYNKTIYPIKQQRLWLVHYQGTHLDKSSLTATGRLFLGIIWTIIDYSNTQSLFIKKSKQYKQTPTEACQS